MMPPRYSCRLILAAAILMLWVARTAGQAPSADRAEPLPSELEGVGIDEHLNTQLPLDLAFVDQSGKTVRLGDYFDGQRPVILTLNYYRCPMLCGLMLNGLLDGMKEIDWSAGDQYRTLTVSFDPLETHQLASVKRDNYLKQYGRPVGAGGWEFLTGRKKSIDALLEATGFRARWSDSQQQWMHVAALILCTPDGHISRYLYGVMFDPQTLRLSLVEASQGKIGTTVDRLLLFCYHYDGTGYSLAGMNIVRATGVLTLVAVAGLLTYFWRRERRRGKTAIAIT
jgi:protein SCO1